MASAWYIVPAVAAALGTIFAGFALLLHGRVLKEEIKNREVQLFNEIRREIMSLHKDLKEKRTNLSREEIKDWDDDYLNTLESFSFLMNAGYIGDRRLANFLNQVIRFGYEKILKDQKDWEQEGVFPELKKLYKQLFKGSSRRKRRLFKLQLGKTSLEFRVEVRKGGL